MFDWSPTSGRRQGCVCPVASGCRLPPHIYMYELMRGWWLCRTGTEEWERLVPLHVRDQIKSLNLLGYTSRERLKMLSANGSTGGNGKSANGLSKKGAAAGAA